MSLIGPNSARFISTVFVHIAEKALGKNGKGYERNFCEQADRRRMARIE